MKDYQSRVIREESELQDKIAGLTRFIDTMIYEQLPPGEREDLEDQKEAMLNYQACLLSRIRRFKS